MSQSINRFAVVFVIALVAACGATTRGRARRFGCSSSSDPRAEEICVSLAKHMEWQWTGHAIIKPGWRITLETLRAVHCEVHLTPNDVPSVMVLESGAGDSELHTWARELHRMLQGSKVKGYPIYDPDSPRYLLATPCTK